MRPWSLALLLAVPAALPACAEVYVDNERAYDGPGGYRIVGEVVNGLEYAVTGVTVRASYEGGESSSAALARTVPPGLRAPFEIEAAGASGGYELDARYAVGAPRSQVMEVTGSEMSSGAGGVTVITGTVSNNGEFTANGVSIVATLYGRDGGVVAVAGPHAGPDYLPAGAEARFVLPVHGGDAGAVSYSLVAESEEYAAVPEFALAPGLLLAGSAAAYVAASRLTAAPPRAAGPAPG